MLSAIFIAIFLIIAIAVFAIRPKIDDRDGVIHLWWVGFFPLVIGLIWGFFACTTIVQAKTVGVPVTFGKPSSSTFDPGLHVKAPWTKVVKIDTTQQVDNFNDGKQDTDHSVVGVELGNKSTASAYLSITWQANGEVANDIYGSYRSDDPTELLYERLVAPNVKQAAQDVLSQYDPMPDKDGNNKPIDYAATAKQIQAAFEAYINAKGGYVTVVDLKFSKLALDEATQKRINEYNSEIQKTKIAEQSIKTSQAQAEANRILSESLAKTSDGAVAYCFSLIEQGKLVPPVGFSCYPGSGSNLILPANK